MEPKSLFASKTFWFNAVLVVGEILQLVLSLNILPPGTAVLIGGIGNIVLRRLTNQPVVVSTALSKPG